MGKTRPAFLLALLTLSVVPPAFGQVPPNLAPLSRVGPQKVAVILARYKSTPDEFRTVDEVREAVWTGKRSASAWFKEASYGKLWLEGKTNPQGDVFAWVTLDEDDTTCTSADLTRWYDNSLTAAQALGFRRDGYDKVIVNLPASDTCGERGGGRAVVGGSRIWMHGRSSPWVFAHELLHSYGFEHAFGLACPLPTGAPTLGASCYRDRADRTDIMGSASQYKHLSAYHKSLLGWIGAANIRYVDAPGIYDLAPIETATTAIQNLRLAYGTIDGVRQVIDLDYRQPIGFDGELALQSYGGSAFTSAAIAGVYLRVAPHDPRQYRPIVPGLIDPDPATSGFQPLMVGVPWTDPAGRVKLTVVSADANKATIRVDAVATGPTTSDAGISPPARDAGAADAAPQTARPLATRRRRSTPRPPPGTPSQSRARSRSRAPTPGPPRRTQPARRPARPLAAGAVTDRDQPRPLPSCCFPFCSAGGGERAGASRRRMGRTSAATGSTGRRRSRTAAPPRATAAPARSRCRRTPRPGSTDPSGRRPRPLPRPGSGHPRPTS
jgi:hypothetical protein